MKIAYKYILVMTLLIIITCSSIIAYSVYREKEAILGQIRKKGGTITNIVALGSISPLFNQDYSTLRRFTKTILEDEDVLSIEISDHNRVIKMHTDLSKLGTKSDIKVRNLYREHITESGNSLFEFSTPIEVDNSTIGFVYIRLSGRNALLRSQSATKVSILLGLLAVTIGVISSIILSKKISRPIIELTTIADEISHGNLNKQIDIKSGGEIGVLVNAFHYMQLNLINHIESKVENERFTLLGKMYGILAHEIRNPLEPIRGSAILLKQKYPDEQTILKYSSIIEEEVGNLSDFLTRFLNFSKPFEPKLILVDINLIINNVLQLTGPFIHKKSIKKQCFLAENIQRIYIDPKQIQQVFMNLILNSVDSMEHIGGNLTIYSNKTEKGVQVIIKDDGCGIKDEDLKKVFEPYFTTKEAGTGLGLTTSREIIKKNGGTIHVESEINLGTTVTIDFRGDINV